MSSEGINLQACRGRQKRLLAEMHRQDLDLVVVTQSEHVQYFTGSRFGRLFSPAAAIRADGCVTLCAPKTSVLESAADEIVTYDAQLHSTLRNDQRKASSEALIKALDGKAIPQRIGVEFSSFSLHLAPLAGVRIDIEPTLYYLRRRKDVDELDKLKIAIAATGKMYEAAREIICPGVTEIEVFNHLHSVAVDYFGEMPTGMGNDYQSGSRGGPPRGDRPAEDGELYILDLGPAYRGYFADTCRTVSVSGMPTEEQQTAWIHVMTVFDHVETSVKPGKSCRELFEEAQQILKHPPLGVFDHHLGHGIGLFPHEAPHLNPHWDDLFEVGDVFTCEPGLYDPLLNAGMRLENNYLVTQTGVVLLSPFPMEL